MQDLFEEFKNSMKGHNGYEVLNINDYYSVFCDLINMNRTIKNEDLFCAYCRVKHSQNQYDMTKFKSEYERNILKMICGEHKPFCKLYNRYFIPYVSIINVFLTKINLIINSHVSKSSVILINNENCEEKVKDSSLYCKDEIKKYISDEFVNYVRVHIYDNRDNF